MNDTTNNNQITYSIDEDGNESVYVNGRIADQELVRELAQIDKALDLFMQSMREKMHAKAVKGWRGWNNPDDKVLIRNLLQEHVTKDIRTAKQMVDVANLAMMVWFIELLENSTIEGVANE